MTLQHTHCNTHTATHTVLICAYTYMFSRVYVLESSDNIRLRSGVSDRVSGVLSEGESEAARAAVALQSLDLIYS